MLLGDGVVVVFSPTIVFRWERKDAFFASNVSEKSKGEKEKVRKSPDPIHLYRVSRERRGVEHDETNQSSPGCGKEKKDVENKAMKTIQHP